MKRNIATIFGILIFAAVVWSQGDTIPRLIISEGHIRNGTAGYLELTNVGDTALDLSNFGVACFSGNGTSNFIYDYDENGDRIRLTIDNSKGDFSTNKNERFRSKLTGTLAPGESWVMTTVGDYRRDQSDIPNYPAVAQSNINNEAKLEFTDFWVHRKEGGNTVPLYNPEIEAWGFDSIDTDYYDIMWVWGDAGWALWYFPPGDSFIIDVINAVLDDNDEMTRLRIPIAGVENATDYNALVRKSTVTVGNIDFDKSRGTSAEDSEWMLLYEGEDQINQSWRKWPYTIGNHGNYSIDATSDLFDINLAAGTMTVPWSTEGGDSIVTDMMLGDGMSWVFWQDSIPGPDALEDSAHVLVRDGDILELFAYGDDREDVSLMISVAEPAAGMARVFPVRERTYDDDDVADGWRTPYTVTEGDPVMDSIRYVPYATRVDTLFKYLEKAPEATWEIVWVDGVERTDVKFGDILKVTSEDGSSVMEYVLSVRPFIPSENAYLQSITWPDYPESELFDWIRGDTLPEFAPGRTQYGIKLPYGTRNVPALVARTQSLRAKMTTTRALNLTGSIADRTTTFTVVSENDSVTYNYKVTFSVDLPPEDRQLFVGEPFISEVHQRWWWNVDAVEIYNPSDVDVDLSQYLFVGGNSTNPADALTEFLGRDSVINWRKRLTKYVPGYLYGDYPTFQANGWILEYDAQVNPIVKPHETFDMTFQGFPTHKPERYNPDLAALSEVDFSAQTGGFCVNTWNDPTIDARNSHPLDKSYYGKWLFKIVNDSILEGTKEVGADINDYELVDCYGFLSTDNSLQRIGSRTMDTPSVMEWRIRRKPYVWHGDLELEAGFDITDAGSNWVADHRMDPDIPNRIVQLETFGSHQAEVVTVHISKITSNVYKVSGGYAGLQSIQGDLNATTMTAFLANINKANPDQMLELHSATDGSVVGDADNVSGNDTLHVTSMNGVNMTLYLLVNDPLDDNATLVPVPGAGITVDISGATGTIGGVMYGQTIASVLDSLEVPGLAILNILDPEDRILPLNVVNYDSILVPTVVSDQVFFEVIAEDGTTILYQLMPASLSSDAFVVSDIYGVDQEGSRISLIPDGTTPAVFYASIVPVKGAVPKILDKLGLERMDGILAYDDKLNVTSEDGTMQKTYFLDFLEETEFETNSAPVVTLPLADTTIAPGAVLSLVANVTDDGNPVPPELTFIWEVEAVVGDVASVTVSNPDQTATDITFAAPGTFIVKASADDREMTGESSINVLVAWPVGIEEGSAPSLLMYPNPANSELHIKLHNLGDNNAEIMLRDIVGKAVYHQLHSDPDVTIDVSSLDAGIYFIQMKTGDHVITRKLNINR